MDKECDVCKEPVPQDKDVCEACVGQVMKDGMILNT